MQLSARSMLGRPPCDRDESGSFCDALRLSGGRWGLAAGDIGAVPPGCSPPTAAHLGVARAIMRQMAQVGGPPSAVLAGVNGALLAGLARAGGNPADPAPGWCSLTATFATIRPSLVGTWIRLSVAGRQTAFLRRSDGRVLGVAPAGPALGERRDPELGDCRLLLRSGDTLLLVTAGGTDMLGGPGAVCELLGGMGPVSAARCTATVLGAVRDAGAGPAHEAAALALRVPASKRDPGMHSAGWPGRGRYREPELPADQGGRAHRSRMPF